MHDTPHATTTHPTQPGATFTWTDGDGHPWTLHATTTELSLTGGDDIHVIARDVWRDAITFSPSSGSVVLHIDLGDREIGFLVPMADARALFVAMGQGVAEARPVSPPSEPENEAVGVARPVDAALWPKMTASAVTAVCAAALAFIPVIGLLFGVLGLVFAVVSLRRERDNAAYAHVRKAGTIALVASLAGMGISLLATYTMWQVANAPADAVSVAGDKMDYGWSAQVAAIIMILIGLSIHEAAHGITAWWCGDGYARAMGRVSLNPLRHIDPFGTVLLPIILMAVGAPAFGYARPVPVRLDGVKRRSRAHILVSAAGPVSNLLQAALFMALLTLIGSLLALSPGATVRNFTSLTPTVSITGIAGASMLSAIVLLLKLGVFVNIILAFFNLIPIPPLDGSWILQHLFPSTLGQLYARVRPFGMLLFLALIWMPGNLLTYLMLPGIFVLFFCQHLLVMVTGFV